MADKIVDRVVDVRTGVLSFGSMTLIVGGLALVGLLLWGWKTGQELPLWPALLVAAVNVFGAVRLVLEAKKRQAAYRAAAAAPGATAEASPGRNGRADPSTRAGKPGKAGKA